MSGQANPSKRVDADRLRRAGFPEAMIAEAVARDAKGVLNHEPPADLVARTIKACERELAEPERLLNPEVRLADVWQSSIEILIRHGFSPGTVRLVARVALAAGSGRHDPAWRERLAAVASSEATPRPTWVWLAALQDLPRTRPRVVVSILGSVLIGVVLLAALARNGAFDQKDEVIAGRDGAFDKRVDDTAAPDGGLDKRGDLVAARKSAVEKRVEVTPSANNVAFPPIDAEQDGSAQLRPEIYAMAALLRETKLGAFQP